MKIFRVGMLIALCLVFAWPAQGAEERLANDADLESLETAQVQEPAGGADEEAAESCLTEAEIELEDEEDLGWGPFEGQFELWGAFAWAGFKMEDPNRDIDHVNQIWAGYGGQYMDHLVAGPVWSGGLVYWLSDETALGLEIERLQARASFEPLPGAEMIWDYQAYALGLTFKYAGAWMENAVWFARGSAGLISLVGAHENYGSSQYLLTGSGFGLRFGGGGQLWVHPSVALGLEVFYRAAVIPEVRLSGEGYSNVELLDEQGNNWELDYSGFGVQAGLALFF